MYLNRWCGGEAPPPTYLFYLNILGPSKSKTEIAPMGMSTNLLSYSSQGRI